MENLEDPYDPRAIANCVINECKEQGFLITNLGLQKLLYFTHGLFLMRTNRPLVSGYFEAWTYGPVHPAAYGAFKEFGAKVISKLATKKDIRSGAEVAIELPVDKTVDRIVRLTVESYGMFSAAQLVHLSHAKGGPWDVVFRRSTKERMMGLRISNELIAERFGYHKASACELNDVGDLDGHEDSPLANYGLG